MSDQIAIVEAQRCACATIWRTNRVLTQFYDESLYGYPCCSLSGWLFIYVNTCVHTKRKVNKDEDDVSGPQSDHAGRYLSGLLLHHASHKGWSGLVYD